MKIIDNLLKYFRRQNQFSSLNSDSNKEIELGIIEREEINLPPSDEFSLSQNFTDILPSPSLKSDQDRIYILSSREDLIEEDNFRIAENNFNRNRIKLRFTPSVKEEEEGEVSSNSDQLATRMTGKKRLKLNDAEILPLTGIDSSSDNPGPSRNCSDYKENPDDNLFNNGFQYTPKTTHKKILYCAIFSALISLCIMVLLGILAVSSTYSSNSKNELLPSPRSDLKLLLKQSMPLPHNHSVSDDENINIAIDYGKKAFEDKKKLESFLIQKGHSPRKHSPSSFHQKGFTKSNSQHHESNKMGYIFDKAAAFFSKRMRYSKEEMTEWVYDMSSSKFCNPPEKKIVCDKKAKYRTINGQCNNLKHPSWGSSFHPFRRILIPDYADGISNPRVSIDGITPLPNPRDLSLKLHSKDFKINSKASLLFPIFGQFLDHDITATVANSIEPNGTSISCCSHEGKLLEENLRHPECMPILLTDSNDPIAKEGKSCMDLVRSAPMYLCRFGPREQINQITSFIDASNIYGSTEEQAMKLRNLTSDSGKLKTYKTEDGRDLLPLQNNTNDVCNIPEKVAINQFCFVSGDERVNEQIGLTSLHLVWTRHHNLIADKLSKLNSHWDGEKIYNETRKIISAYIQHITYTEYLPILLGKEVMDRFSISIKENGIDSSYDDQIDPSISNAFASAAYRFGHSMIQGLFKLSGIGGPYNKNEDISYIQLHKIFFNPFKLYEKDKLDDIIRGASSYPAAEIDPFFTPQLTDHLFQVSNESSGLDLVSINIQRGREHGIKGYLSWRKVCALSPILSFEDLKDIWQADAYEIIINSTNLYKSVEDIDLYIGGLAERPIPGGMLGATFTCLLAEQFFRLKIGDRFWYEGEIQPYPFTKEQLREIRKIKLSRILCENGDNIINIQPNVLLQISADNAIVSCKETSKIPIINLNAWEDVSLKDNKNHKNEIIDEYDEDFQSVESIESDNNSPPSKNELQQEVKNKSTNYPTIIQNSTIDKVLMLPIINNTLLNINQTKTKNFNYNITSNKI